MDAERAPDDDIYLIGRHAAQGGDVIEPFGQGTLLIVDDEDNILSALRRALRKESYRVITASSGAAGLQVLHQEAVDVVLSDQRMPGMSGVDFLRQAKVLRPHTVRMVLSGYSELAAVTAAINEGAIYKYLTKPWDDEFLRASIREAFVRKGLSDENRRLANALSIAHDQLENHNELLQVALAEQRRRQVLSEHLLRLSRDAVDRLPVPVLGVDLDGCVLLINQAALALAPMLNCTLGTVWPPLLAAACRPLLDAGDCGVVPLRLGQRTWQLDLRPLDPAQARGHLITLLPAAL